MNALQHYKRGEALLAKAENDLPAASAIVTGLTAMAHAHFAAALVGATMTSDRDLDGAALYRAAVIGS